MKQREALSPDTASINRERGSVKKMGKRRPVFYDNWTVFEKKSSSEEKLKEVSSSDGESGTDGMRIAEPGLSGASKNWLVGGR